MFQILFSTYSLVYLPDCSSNCMYLFVYTAWFCLEQCLKCKVKLCNIGARMSVTCCQQNPSSPYYDLSARLLLHCVTCATFSDWFWFNVVHRNWSKWGCCWTNPATQRPRERKTPTRTDIWMFCQVCVRECKCKYFFVWQIHNMNNFLLWFLFSRGSFRMKRWFVGCLLVMSLAFFVERSNNMFRNVLTDRFVWLGRFHSLQRRCQMTKWWCELINRSWSFDDTVSWWIG